MGHVGKVSCLLVTEIDAPQIISVFFFLFLYICCTNQWNQIKRVLGISWCVLSHDMIHMFAAFALVSSRAIKRGSVTPSPLLFCPYLSTLRTKTRSRELHEKERAYKDSTNHGNLFLFDDPLLHCCVPPSIRLRHRRLHSRRTGSFTASLGMYVFSLALTVFAIVCQCLLVLVRLQVEMCCLEGRMHVQSLLSPSPRIDSAVGRCSRRLLRLS